MDPGENLYVRHYAEAGFYSHASELQAGDVILMQYRADEINHAGIYGQRKNVAPHVWPAEW